MMIWVVMGLVAVVVIGVLLLPLFKTQAPVQDRAAYDMTVFQDQLAEVDRDVERGVLTAEQAEAARLEIQRRMLATEKAPAETHSSDSRRKRMAAAAAVAVLVLAGAAGIYMKVGAPGLTGGASEDAAKQAAEDAQIEKMMGDLAAKVKENPNDVDSVALLARSYAMTGKFDEAVTTYGQLVTLAPNADNFAGLGEVMVYANDGHVNQDAHDAFVKALAIDKEEPRGRYYLGEEQADQGNFKGAISIWRQLIETSPKDAGWVAMVQERVDAVSKQSKITAADVPPMHALEFVPSEEVMMAKVQGAAPPAALAAPSKPKAPSEMPPEMRQKVEEMVAGLATRLKDNPKDYDGWLMLGRSYTVLKNYDGAKQAYDKAAGLKPTDVEPRMQYLAALMATVDITADGPLPPSVVDAATEVLKLDPKQGDALYISGLAKVRSGDKAGARAIFTQAKAVMADDAPLKTYVDRQLKDLDETH